MPTSTDVTNLKINQLTEAQYDTAVRGGVIGANEISILTDAEVGQTIQVDVLPTASADELGNIYQFVGTTDSTYTNGYFYKCTESGGVYSWVQTDVQPSSSGGVSDVTVNGTSVVSGGVATITVPTVNNATLTITQGGTTKGTFTANAGTDVTIDVDAGGGSSYTAGTGIDITNGTISTKIPLNISNVGTYGNSSLGLNTTAAASKRACIFIGEYSSAGGGAVDVQSTVCIGNSTQGSNYSISVGEKAATSNTAGYNICIGYNAKVTGSQTKYAIQLGCGSLTSPAAAINSDSNTFKVANENGNFEMLSADGTIPTARLTKVNSTITLTAASWSNGSQTVNVTGMTATGVVLVSPDPTDQADYTSAGILCTAQAAGTLTFSCDSVPSGDIDVNVVML